ncbi:hypothetical protein [Chromobacterium amazonense]|uniref:hypothetical protein n=1 Tax=Chromobacterium amazonense TaxID=1382803 RepID=UPI00166FC07C|nr:hypothetical protein [Chromobacterium amazonense]
MPSPSARRFKQTLDHDKEPGKAEASARPAGAKYENGVLLLNLPKRRRGGVGQRLRVE